MRSFINVRIGRLPGRISEIVLNGDRTVATALMTAGLDSAGYDIRVQGAPASMTTGLNEGDIVLLVKKIKGNGGIEGATFVHVGRVPGPGLVQFALDEPTVFMALSAAGLNLGPDEVVYRNDQLSSIGEPVEDGDKIVVRHPMPAMVAASPELPSGLHQTAPVVSATFDFSAVVGTDPAQLCSSAERLTREAEELEAGARAALASAAEKKVAASAHWAKAAAIETANEALANASAQLETLGVIRPKGEGRWTDIRRLFGLS